MQIRRYVEMTLTRLQAKLFWSETDGLYKRVPPAFYRGQFMMNPLFFLNKYHVFAFSFKNKPRVGFIFIQFLITVLLLLPKCSTLYFWDFVLRHRGKINGSCTFLKLIISLTFSSCDHHSCIDLLPALTKYPQLFALFILSLPLLPWKGQSCLNLQSTPV